MSEKENFYNHKEAFPYLLYALNRLYTIYINRELKEFNLTKTELAMLGKISNKNNQSQKELAEYFELNESSVARTLVRLEKKEFIIRFENPKNKREKIVNITEKGNECLNNVDIVQKEFHKYLFEDFGEDEKIRLQKDLKKLIDLIHAKI